MQANYEKRMDDLHAIETRFQTRGRLAEQIKKDAAQLTSQLHGKRKSRERSRESRKKRSFTSSNCRHRRRRWKLTGNKSRLTILPRRATPLRVLRSPSRRCSGNAITRRRKRNGWCNGRTSSRRTLTEPVFPAACSTLPAPNISALCARRKSDSHCALLLERAISIGCAFLRKRC